jgi:hypothetical protein
MIILIFGALTVLPSQLEQLGFIYMEKQKRGGSYSRHRAANESHVVVCSTTLQTNVIMDFLNEFYAHPMLQVKSFYLSWSNFGLEFFIQILRIIPLCFYLRANWTRTYQSSYRVPSGRNELSILKDRHLTILI